MRRTKKNQKRIVSMVLTLLMVVGCVHLDGVEVKASMASEAMDFQIGDTLQGSIMEDDQTDYYRFTLNSRQRIVIKGLSPDREHRDGPINTDDEIFICDENGYALMQVESYRNTFWKYNAATDLYTLNLVATLNKGTYYIGICRCEAGSDYSFTTEYAPSTRYPSMQLSITMSQGDSLKLGTVIAPEKAASKLKWKTSNKSVASISAKGTVKAKKAGTATITASCNGSKIKFKIIVK